MTQLAPAALGAGLFDHVLVNDDLDKTYASLKGLVQSEIDHVKALNVIKPPHSPLCMFLSPFRDANAFLGMGASSACLCLLPSHVRSLLLLRRESLRRVRE